MPFINQEILFTKEDVEHIKSFVNFDNFQQSKISNSYGKVIVDEKIRKTKALGIKDQELTNFVIEKLKKWNVKRIGDTIQFLNYGKGDFFTKHRDRIDGIEDTYNRYMTLIVQLSEQKDYEGGNMYVNDILFEKEIGNSIMFDSGLEHEVLEISSGQRLVMVMWLSVNDFFEIKKTNSLI